MSCPSCGHENPAGARFCNDCGARLAAPATSVRVRDGKRLVTDGPFAETREVLGGFYLIDARDLDEAIAIAALIPPARKGTIEIWPVMEVPGLPTD